MPEIKQDIRATTFVVAANDSLHRNDADYVCVPPDTLVFTNSMVKPISEIKLGEKVLSHSGYREATKIFRRPYIGNLIEIKTFGGETFKLTPNHPVYAIKDTLVEDGYSNHAQTHHRLRKLVLNYSPQWIRADKLREGDIVLLRFPSEERAILEINLTDYLTTPFIEQDGGIWGIGKNQTGKLQRNPRAYKLPKTIPVNEDFLKLAGFYLAEGSPSKNNICLYFGKHETELINEAKRLFEKVFGIKAHSEDTRTSTRVYINSVLLANFFENLFGIRAEGKHLPEWMLYLPHSKQRVLLDAYSAGDGCKDSKRERFVSVSQQLAYQVRQILYRLGRQNSIRKEPAGEYEIEGRKGFAQEKFEVCASFNANHSFVDKHFAYLPVRDISQVPYEGEVCNLRVAGANSYTIAGATLHNCDGIADEVEINQALNALPAQGGRVKLLEGTYVLAHPITIPDHYIILEGQGWNTLIDGDGLPTTEHGIVISSFSGVHIKNLAIQTQNGGGKVCHCIFIEDGANEFVIDKVYFVDSDNDAIHIEGTSITRGWILDNFIEGADDYGIFVDMDALNPIANLIIKGNYIASAGVDGIFFGNTGTGADHCTISLNNIVSNVGNGIYIWDGQFLTINDNTLDFNTGYGIYLRSVDDSVVEDNVIQQSNLHNIYLNTCAQILVEGNYTYGAQDNAADNIHVDTNCAEIQVMNNFSIWAGRYGIFFSGSRGACSGNRVQSSGDDGIRIDIADFQCNGNHINDCGRDVAGTYHGIKVSGTSDRGQIIGNYIMSDGAVTEDGIHLESNAQYIQIIGNFCFDGMGSGIHLVDDNDYCLIKDNLCLENDDYGINIAAATCNENTVKNNKLLGNITGQILDSGTDTILPEVFVPVPSPNSFIGTHPAERLQDGVDVISRFNFYIPVDFVELVRCTLTLVAGGSGNLRRTVATNWGKVCTTEHYNAGTDAIAAGQVAVLINDMTCIDIADALTGIAAQDLVGVEFTREALNALDTVNADCFLLGLRMQYV